LYFSGIFDYIRIITVTVDTSIITIVRSINLDNNSHRNVEIIGTAGVDNSILLREISFAIAKTL
jgi:hypothetical protein